MLSSLAVDELARRVRLSAGLEPTNKPEPSRSALSLQPSK